MLVSRKKKAVTLGLPPEIADALDEATGIVNGKQKWLVFSASVLLFIDAPEALQRTLMAHVASAEIGMEAFDSLLAKARAGKLRAEIDVAESKSGRTTAKTRKTASGSDPSNKG